MEDLDAILEVSREEGAQDAAREGRGGGGPGWFLGTGLVLLFVLVGLVAIVATWSAFYAMIGSERILFRLVPVLAFAAPTLLWLLLLGILRRWEWGRGKRLGLLSGIGFLIAVAIAHVVLLPWALFGIAFRDVRM